MSKKNGVIIEMDTPLQPWRYYVEEFETKQSQTSAQVFYDWGRSAFHRLINN